MPGRHRAPDHILKARREHLEIVRELVTEADRLVKHLRQILPAKESAFLHWRMEESEATLTAMRQQLARMANDACELSFDHPRYLKPR